MFASPMQYQGLFKSKAQSNLTKNYGESVNLATPRLDFKKQKKILTDVLKKSGK